MEANGGIIIIKQWVYRYVSISANFGGGMGGWVSLLEEEGVVGNDFKLANFIAHDAVL